MHIEPPPRRILSTSVAAAALLTSAIASAATHTAASCSVADVQAAVTGASNGDTVLVPGGSCTWTGQVAISKGITLDGRGVTITFGPGSSLNIQTDSVASTILTGFTFNNGFTNGNFPIRVGTTSSPFNAPFRIYNNTLDDDGQQGGPVTIIGIVGFGPGLIDHNTFTTSNGADEVIHLLGSGSTSDTSGWSNDVVPGGPNMTFIENNVFTCTSPTYAAQAEEAFYGAQFVFRHNHLTFDANDVHQGGLGGRWAEIYDNTYEVNGIAKNPTNPLSGYWQFRGGSGVVFGNVSSGSPCCQDPYPGAQFGPDCPSSDQCTGTWPIPTQVGTGINQTTHSPIYVWGNSQTINGSTQSIQDSIGYTNGTQAGATPTSCTHPGNVCDVVATNSAPSSWVRCESAADLAAGCPVSYTYKPYTYPHPLDDLPASCFGVGCAAEAPDGGAATDGSTSVDGGSVSDGGGAADGGRDGMGTGAGCGCAVRPARTSKTGVAMLLVLVSALVVFSRRRRSARRQGVPDRLSNDPRRAVRSRSTDDCSRA